MTKHTILFLAANPEGANPQAPDQVRAIQAELERSASRDQFEFVTRWAIEPMDLLRELRKIRPSVVHFSGHGLKTPSVAEPGGSVQRDIGHPDENSAGGLYFQAADGGARLVSATAIEQVFGAAGSSVRLVVLNASYSAEQAEALLAHVDCVVGMGGAIRDDAARHFAVGFYGGLGERESVAAAYRQGKAAISLEGLRESDLPQLHVRARMDAERIVLGAVPAAAGAGGASDRGDDLKLHGGGANGGQGRLGGGAATVDEAVPGTQPIANVRRFWTLRKVTSIDAASAAPIRGFVGIRFKNWALAGGAIAVLAAVSVWNLRAVMLPGDGTPPFAILVLDPNAAAMLSPAREDQFTYAAGGPDVPLPRSGIILGTTGLPGIAENEYRQIVHDGLPLEVERSGSMAHVLVKYEGVKHCEIDINLMEKRIWKVHLAPLCD